jgi:hypothetical protein
MSTTKTLTTFPFVTFTNTEGKEFCIERDRFLHFETYCERNVNGDDVLDPSKTFVNFKSPNHKSKGSLHAVVDMPLASFRDWVIRPAFEGLLT